MAAVGQGSLLLLSGLSNGWNRFVCEVTHAALPRGGRQRTCLPRCLQSVATEGTRLSCSWGQSRGFTVLNVHENRT